MLKCAEGRSGKERQVYESNVGSDLGLTVYVKKVENEGKLFMTFVVWFRHKHL